MFDEKNRFVIRDYQNKPAFSSFLPGIAGPMGIPVWCYYNNRGQAVCSFGVQDKDHSIMEFSSAHSAYQNVSRTGFRTFVKANGATRELFTGKTDMHIGMSEVEIRCCSVGRELLVRYHNPGKLDFGAYQIGAVRCGGRSLVLPACASDLDEGLTVLDVSLVPKE